MGYAAQMPVRSLAKKLLVLILGKVKSYFPPLRLKNPITMTGQYLIEGQYNDLLREKRAR
jgi:hypothetical protein